MIERGIGNLVEKRYKDLMFYSSAIAVLCAVIGFVLLFLSSLSNKMIGVIIGIAILLYGATLIYKYLQRDGAKIFALNIVFGLICGLIGIILIAVPFEVVRPIELGLGFFLLTCGATKINYGVWLRIGKEQSWLITVVTGIFYIIYGFMVFFNPFSALEINQLAGAFLIIDGILEFSNTMLLKNRGEKVMEIFW